MASTESRCPEGSHVHRLMTRARVPLVRPVFEGREREYLARCIDEGWVASGGHFVREFEGTFGALHDRSSAVSTASGTAALHVALTEAGVGPGDEVIVPTLTFV